MCQLWLISFVHCVIWDTFVIYTLHNLSVNVYCVQFLQGESTVAKMWQNSGLQWSSFVPSSEVRTFLSNRKLDWLENVNICVHYMRDVTFCFAFLAFKLLNLPARECAYPHLSMICLLVGYFCCWQGHQ